MVTISPIRFVCIPKDKWILNANIGASRWKTLTVGITFEEIVHRILERSSITNYRRERLGANPQYYRIVVELKVDSETVDLFHNSLCGYRAQYYDSINMGERANKYAVESLAPRISELLSGTNKRTCPLWLVEKSLSDIHAKIWIHQGLWLRKVRNTDQNLLVARWRRNQSNVDKTASKKARWASLTPKEEARLDIKGAYFTLEGKPFGRSIKPNRGKDIHQYGFT